MTSPDPTISRTAIVRGVLAIACGLAAFAGFEFDVPPVALGMFVAAVCIAPRNWINVDSSSRDSLGPM